MQHLEYADQHKQGPRCPPLPLRAQSFVYGIPAGSFGDPRIHPTSCHVRSAVPVLCTIAGELPSTASIPIYFSFRLLICGA